MRIIIFGASGMVGRSVLNEALHDQTIDKILIIGRRPLGLIHPKLLEIVIPDLFNVQSIEDQLFGYDACIWAIGISSVGLTEIQYAKITKELTCLWIDKLIQINPSISFCYCSAGGAGGNSMWAGVRQQVENYLHAMPFLNKGVVRPGFIKPGPGIRSRTRAYQIGIWMISPLFLIYPLLLRYCPFLFTTSELLGRAMLAIVNGQTDKFILESVDINHYGKKFNKANLE